MQQTTSDKREILQEDDKNHKLSFLLARVLCSSLLFCVCQCMDLSLVTKEDFISVLRESPSCAT